MRASTVVFGHIGLAGVLVEELGSEPMQMRLCVGFPKAQGVLVSYIACLLIVLNELDLIRKEVSITVDMVEVYVAYFVRKHVLDLGNIEIVTYWC